jgi:hypothetical protein
VDQCTIENLNNELQGGGGLEIWQYLDRVPQESEPIEAGDLGINSVILKSINIETSHQRLKSIKDIKFRLLLIVSIAETIFGY